MTKQKIMLVEDEAITALDIKHMLEKNGYEVSAVISTGREAVEKVDEIKPDLILMDIMLMDELDGIQANESIIKKINVPIVYLTASTDPSTINRADKSKHYGYIIKPVSRKDLFSIISTAIQRHNLEKNSA
ncbi:MAG: response regulator [Spirochaetes bacterium]|nr:response regulator [Spirochaetota bacterium]